MGTQRPLLSRGLRQLSNFIITCGPGRTQTLPVVQVKSFGVQTAIQILAAVKVLPVVENLTAVQILTAVWILIAAKVLNTVQVLTVVDFVDTLVRLDVSVIITVYY